MTNYQSRTAVQRRNERMFQMFERAKVLKFAAEWKRQQGYEPAPFQKAIAMQRLERGQSIQEIIDALISMRIS